MGGGEREALGGLTFHLAGLAVYNMTASIQESQNILLEQDIGLDAGFWY
jgi:hypothetical protein